MLRDSAFLLDILREAKAVLSFVQGVSEQEFKRNIQCQYAVIRGLEVIGEAANRMSDFTRQVHPEIPWSEMISMRNRMIHEYERLDLSVVWETVQKDLPRLVEQVEPLVPTQEDV